MAEVITLQQPEVCYSYSQFLPDVVRVLEVSYEIDDDFRTHNIAIVCGNTFQGTLTWMSRYYDPQIRKGSLARVHWPNELSTVDGCHPVVRVVPISSVDPSVNLFDTIPRGWLKNSSLIERAKELWEQLSQPMQLLFNMLYWDSACFQRYVCVPASIDGHHNGWGGNLRHAVETAEHAERIALDVAGVSNSLLILACFLYNAPVVEACRWRDGHWQMPNESVMKESQVRFQGRLEAVLRNSPDCLSTGEHQILWQMLFGLNAARLEIQQQPSAGLEGEILCMADRLSRVINQREQGGLQ